MKITQRLGYLLCLGSLWSTVAFASPAQDAIALNDDLAAAVLWAQLGECPDAKEEADLLACQEAAARLRAMSSNKVYFVSRPSRITAGIFGRRRSLPITVDSCIFCDGVDVLGKKTIVAGRTRAQETQPKALRETAVVFKSKDDADAWIEDVMPRLLTELWFQFPETPLRFRAHGARGLLVDLKAYTVFDPCTGEIIASSPPRKRRAPAPDLCRPHEKPDAGENNAQP